MSDAKPPLQVAIALPSIDDPLILALISKLPAAGKPFAGAERVNWLRMMVMALNATYGLEAPIDVDTERAGDRKRFERPALFAVPKDGGAPIVDVGPAPEAAAPRYVVDQEGFAMCGVKPIGPEEIPAGAVLWDERAPAERFDVGTILWAREGTRPPEKLPKLDVRAA